MHKIVAASTNLCPYQVSIYWFRSCCEKQTHWHKDEHEIRKWKQYTKSISPIGKKLNWKHLTGWGYIVYILREILLHRYWKSFQILRACVNHHHDDRSVKDVGRSNLSCLTVPSFIVSCSSHRQHVHQSSKEVDPSDLICLTVHFLCQLVLTSSLLWRPSLFILPAWRVPSFT
jgi:hypothetical protein